MRRGARRGAEWQDGADHVRKLRSPLIRLAPGHGPPRHQRNPLHAERLGEQPVLARNVVVEGDGGEPRAVEGRCGVARRGRQTVAEHVDRHDEVARRIEGRHRAQVALVARVRAGIEGRHDDHVAAARVERAVRLVGEPRIRQRDTGLQRHLAELEYLVVWRHFRATPHLLSAVVRALPSGTGPPAGWWLFLLRSPAHGAGFRPTMPP